MTTPLQARFRDDELADLRLDVCDLVNDWAAILLAVDVSSLDKHPAAEVLAHKLTAVEALRAELETLSRLIEWQAWQAGMTLQQIAEGRAVTQQAVSQRLKAA